MPGYGELLEMNSLTSIFSHSFEKKKKNSILVSIERQDKSLKEENTEREKKKMINIFPEYKIIFKYKT